jgi:hypothetical protein
MTARRPRRLAVPQITAAFFSMTRKYSIIYRKSSIAGSIYGIHVMWCAMYI